jgi:hypothetical protein
LRRDPDGLEIIRQRFIQLKIPDAVAELTLATNATVSASKSVPSPALKAVVPDKS